MVVTFNGEFKSSGSATDHVTITSASSSPAPGNWYSLSLFGGPNNLTYTDIKFGIYGVYVHNNNGTNLFTNCTMQNCSAYGLYSYLTLIQPNAVKLKDCLIGNTSSSNVNVYGVTASNSRVDLETTSSSDATKGILYNTKYGAVLYDGGVLYMKNFRIGNNGSAGSYAGIYVNGPTATAVLSPDKIAAGYNWVYNNSGGQIRILNQSSTNPVFLGDATNGGYNHIYGNCPWINNSTATQVKARRTYWGAASPPYQCPPSPSCFSGSVDYSNCLSAGNIPFTIPIAISEETDHSSASTDFSTTGIGVIDPFDAIQTKMDSRNYDQVISLADNYLLTNPPDGLWFYCNAQKIHALIGKGDLLSAEASYNSIKAKGTLINSQYLSLMGETINLEKAARGTSGNQSSFIKLGNNARRVPGAGFILSQNYPNLFNPATEINYTLFDDGFASLKVFDVLGREVATLVNGYEQAGHKSVRFDASKLPSGIYFYKLTTKTFSDVKKMMIAK